MAVYAYIGRGASGLAIYDVTDPAAPVAKGTLAGLGTVTCTQIKGNYCYVGTSTDGIRVVNISNKLSPVLATSITAQTNITWLKIVNNTLYYVSGGVLYIYDVTNPASPTLLSSYSATAIGTRFAVLNGYLYTQSGGYLRKISVSNPLDVSLTASLALPLPVTGSSTSIDTRAVNGSVFVVYSEAQLTYQSVGVAFVNPATLTISRSAGHNKEVAGSAFYSYQCGGIAANDSLAVVTIKKYAGLVSNPSTSSLISTFTDLDTSTTTYTASVTALTDTDGGGYSNTVYTITATGFDAVDVTTPASAAVLSSTSLSGITSIDVSALADTTPPVVTAFTISNYVLT